MKRTGRFQRDKRAFRTKLDDALRVSGYEQANVSDVEFDFLWEYATAPKLTALSADFVSRRQAILDSAVSGVQSAMKFFEGIPGYSQHVQPFRRGLADLQSEQAKKLSVLPSRPRGHDRDWSVVEMMQESLNLPAERVAALLNAADVAAGFERETTPQDLQRRLKAIKQRIS